MSPPLRLLLCSAPEDDALAIALEKHLGLLESAGLITVWSARDVLAGGDRARLLAAEIARAEVFVLLLSASFFSASECADLVMIEALRRHRAREALVIPVLLRPVDWEVTDLRDLALLPPNLLAVTLFHDVDEAFSRVAREVRRRVEDRVSGRDRDPPPPAVDRAEPDVGARSLDAAIPARVVKGERTEVLAMVATAGSGGLRALIGAKPTAFPVTADDVRSTAFPLKFPHDHQGKPHPTVVTVMIASADFDPPTLTKKILVPPHADSTVCTMLVTPRKVGVLSLQIEVQQDEMTIWSQRLATTGAETAEGAAPGYVVASAPLYTVSTARMQLPKGPVPVGPPAPWPATKTTSGMLASTLIGGMGGPPRPSPPSPSPPPPSPPAEAGDSPDDVQAWLQRIESPRIQFEEHRPIPPPIPIPSPPPMEPDPSTRPPAPMGSSPDANLPVHWPTPPPIDPEEHGPNTNAAIRIEPAGSTIDVDPITTTNIRVEPSDPAIDEEPNTNANIRIGPASTNANTLVEPPPPATGGRPLFWLLVLGIAIAVALAATRVAGLWP